MADSWKSMDLNKFVVKVDMIDYVLHKYGSNWQVHDAIADDILGDLLKREWEKHHHVKFVAYVLSVGICVYDKRKIMDINKGKEKMVMERDNQDRDLVLRRKKEKSLDYNNSFSSEYEYSSLALDREERRDEKKRLDHLKQDQTMAPRYRSYEIIATKHGFGSNEEEVVPKVDDVTLVDGVFDGAFGGDGEEDVVMGEGIVVTSSSLEMLTKSFLSGMMVSLIFLEELEEEA
ncbi:hypothetical protein Tco_1112695 [Tanacetum coccineum]|uniref:Uncharacterized protein n=1 Tax=Tanacetum coccineum TaxID=301880 RepID=A0ABQ5ISE4_9ASTR